MQLSGKSAVVYGANSPTGAAVARAFAREGAVVYLAGRSAGRLEPVAREIADAGGTAHVAEVDPLDLNSVSEHLHGVAVQHGSVDVSVNLAFLGVEGAGRLCNLTEEQFDAASFTRVRSNFVTSAAAVREMAYLGRGIILATGVPEWAAPVGKLAGPAIGSAAIEGLCQQLRLDVGSFGVQVAYVAGAIRSEEEMAERLLHALASFRTPSRSPSAIPAEAPMSTSTRQPEDSVGVATG